MSGSDFNELLQAAEQLSADVEGTGELPRVERTLREVLDASSELWTRVAQTGPQNIQAHLLLGSKGVDLPKLSQKLDTLSTRKTFEPLEPMSDVDIQSFLKNEQENALLSIIEETNKSCFEDVEKQQLEHMLHEWKQEQQRALNTLLGAPEDFNIGLEHQEGRVAYDDIQSLETIAFCTVIIYKSYMNNVVTGNLKEAQRGGIPGTYPLVRSFVNIRVPQGLAGLEDGMVDDQPVWALIYYCLRCGDIKAALHCIHRASPQVKEFSTILQDIEKSPDLKLNPQAEVFLQRQYRQQIKHMTDPYKSYSSPMASLVLTDSSQLTAKSFEKLPDQIMYSYVEPFDPQKHVLSMAKAADDYLWFKLWQIREESLLPLGEPHSGEKLTYAHLQSLILEEYGESHYNAQEKPLVYYQVLFLTGQFEAALEFLFRVDKFRVHAVHMAMAMHQQNLLALPASFDASLLTEDSKYRGAARRLNYARLIILYVRRFETTDIKEALNYYYFLREIKGPENENLFAMCVADLAQETQQFAVLFGHLRQDGCRAPGLVDTFQGAQVTNYAGETDGNKHHMFREVRQSLILNDCTETLVDPLFVIEKAASVSEERGLTEDAINLYDLSGLQAVAPEHRRELSASTIRRRLSESGLKARSENQKLTPAMIGPCHTRTGYLKTG
uniref:Nuclear pore protein n=1 Tax=Timema californicum TaxID=61474 RepID=A0A7R9JAD8_TIMCA|nr:unnamed protein product [Timema californicum]